jgi:hypothetical protein
VSETGPNPTQKHRKLRIAFSAVCGIVCLLLIALWVRSYWFADTIGLSQRFSLSTYRGELVVGIVTDNSGFFQVDQGYASQELSDVFDSWNVRGAAHPTWSVLLARGEALPGSLNFIVVEFYTLLSIPLIAALVAAPWMRWSNRFSLRTLLIGMTLIAALLGAIVWASK